MNRELRKTIFKISTFLVIITGISTLLYFSLRSTDYKVVRLKKFQPIYGNITVTVKNMVTKDKKYYWMRVNVSWAIDRLSKPIEFRTSNQIKNYINSYLKGVTDSAIILAMLGKSSLDIFGSKKDFEEDIEQKIKERLKSIIIDKEDIKILNVRIMRYKYFDEKYEGEDFPPLPNRGNYIKTKPRLIKETPYPLKDSQ